MALTPTVLVAGRRVDVTGLRSGRRADPRGHGGPAVTRLTVALSGDCMATRGALIGSDPAAGQLRELLHGADFAVTNLEVVPADGRGHPVHNAAGGGRLIADSGVLDEITAAGFTVLGCANNHTMDLGTEGVLGTVDQLRSRRIPFAGIGADLTAARRPVYVDRPGGSLALLACTATFLPEARKRPIRRRSCPDGRASARCATPRPCG
ncbi:CapA family protein [Streptomyces sp. L7]